MLPSDILVVYHAPVTINSTSILVVYHAPVTINSTQAVALTSSCNHLRITEPDLCTGKYTAQYPPIYPIFISLAQSHVNIMCFISSHMFIYPPHF
jgi:hypothetical protein